MSNYDLGSIGWTVESKGTKEALGEVAALGRNLLDAEGSAIAFAKAILKVERDMTTLNRVNIQGAKNALAFRDAIDDISGVSGDFKSAKDSASAFGVVLNNIEKQSKETVTSINSITGVSGTFKSARDSASAFNVVLDNIEAQARQTAISINSITGVSGVSALNSGAGTSALVADYDRLVSKYNLVKVATNFVESELRDLKRAELEGIITTEQYTASVDKLNKEFQQFSAQSNQTQQTLNRFMGTVEESRKGYARYGLAVQQVGYQVGDFFVQIQSGTNALVAFGQQATQLVGIGFLSPNPYIQMGAAIGSVVIPLVTALGAAFMRTSNEASKAYNQALDSIEERVKGLKAEFLNFKFGVDDSSVSLIMQKIEDVKKELGLAQMALFKNDFGLNAAAAMGFAMQEGGLKAQIADNQAILDELHAQLRIIENIQAAKDVALLKSQALLANITQTRQSYLALNTLIQISGGLLQTQANNAHALAIQNMGATIAQSNALKQAMSDIASANISDDATLFADAMKRALDNGVLFSNVDLATVVSVAAANGWNLAASLQAAWAAATRGATGAANVPFIPSSGLGTPPIRSPLAPEVSVRPPKAPNNPDFNIPSGAGSGGGGGGSASDPIGDLQKQIDLEKELSDKTEAQKQIINALGIEWRNYSPEVIAGLEQQIQAQLDLNDKIEEQQGLYDSIGSSVENSFMSIVTGTETVQDAFRTMAYNIIEELYKVLVVQRMVGSFDVASGTGTGLMGILAGSPSGSPSGKAVGGSVNSGQPYLVGEKGPELIVPKHSGTVVNAQQTSAMGTSNSQTVNNNINVVGSDAAAVRREVAKMVPQIVQATQAAMIDSKRRGGRVASAFN